MSKKMMITITDELHKVLAEFSKESGVAAASLVSNILQESLHQIEQLTEIFKAAKVQPTKALDLMMESVLKHQEQLGKLSGSVLEDKRKMKLAKGAKSKKQKDDN
jgi:hypothetical protein